MTKRLGIGDLFDAIPEGSSVIIYREKSNVNRCGFLIHYTGFNVNDEKGLVSKTFFVGEDIDPNSDTLGDFVIEQVK